MLYNETREGCLNFDTQHGKLQLQCTYQQGAIVGDKENYSQGGL